MLDFDVDADDLERVVRELDATPKEINAAYNKALSRTAGTLRKMSSKGLVSELGLRRAKAIRRRLKTIRIKGSTGSDFKKMASVQLWYGLNPLPVSEFKGRVSENAGGAQYSGPAGSHDFPGAFVARSTSAGRRTIMRRKGRSRLPIKYAVMPIRDRAEVFIEDQIFDQLVDIFWRHFRDDLTRRIAYLRSR